MPAERALASAGRRITCAGETLRTPLRSGDDLERRTREPDYTLRRHLREIGGAIEV